MCFLKFRPISSDWISIKQVYGEQQYKCLCGLSDVKVIVDLGAYAGYASYYLKTHYPQAELFAIEPQPDVCKLLIQNLASFSGIHVIKAAIWDKNVDNLFLKQMHVKGESSLHQTGTRVVDTVTESVSFVKGITMLSLIEAYNIARIDILKIDVEDVETRLFKDPVCNLWLHKVKNIGIEIHSDTSREAVLCALKNFSYVSQRVGEVDVFKNISPRA